MVQAHARRALLFRGAGSSADNPSTRHSGSDTESRRSHTLEIQPHVGKSLVSPCRRVTPTSLRSFYMGLCPQTQAHRALPRRGARQRTTVKTRQSGSVEGSEFGSGQDNSATRLASRWARYDKAISTPEKMVLRSRVPADCLLSSERAGESRMRISQRAHRTRHSCAGPHSVGTSPCPCGISTAVSCGLFTHGLSAVTVSSHSGHPTGVRICVKSLQSSYIGLHPQTVGRRRRSAMQTFVFRLCVRGQGVG